MRRKRRNHLPAFKAKVALEAFKGDKTLSELAEKYELHSNQITDWKKQLLKHAGSIFGSTHDEKKYTDECIKDMQAKIGQQTLEIDFLSKVLGR